ncbi:MAG: cyanoexosortase A system-associated protein [Cyanobacteria bacterium P01_A01_bin.45]
MIITASKIRISLLSVTCGAVFLSLGSIVMRSPNYEQGADSFSFPVRVKLLGWKQVSSTRKLDKIEKNSEIINQKLYQYIQNDLALDIEMRYSKEIKVRSLIKKYQGIEKPAEIRQRPNIGYYGIGFDRGRVYLSACITPQGNSTYTYEQFRENEEYISRLDIKHILNWILGKNRLREERCLWTHLSMSVEKSSPKQNYQLLEKAWFSWYKYWQSSIYKN